MMQKMVLFFGLIFISGLVCAEDESEAAPVEYIPVPPKLIVNLKGRRSYLRTDVQLLAEDSESAEKIKTHLPAVRHALIMLISDYAPDQLNSMEKREELRKKALEETRTILGQYASSKGLGDLFFTEFLVQ